MLISFDMCELHILLILNNSQTNVKKCKLERIANVVIPKTDKLHVQLLKPSIWEVNNSTPM